MRGKSDVTIRLPHGGLGNRLPVPGWMGLPASAYRMGMESGEGVQTDISQCEVNPARLHRIHIVR